MQMQAMSQAPVTEPRRQLLSRDAPSPLDNYRLAGPAERLLRALHPPATDTGYVHQVRHTQPVLKDARKGRVRENGLICEPQRPTWWSALATGRMRLGPETARGGERAKVRHRPWALELRQNITKTWTTKMTSMKTTSDDDNDGDDNNGDNENDGDDDDDLRPLAAALQQSPDNGVTTPPHERNT